MTDRPSFELVQSLRLTLQRLEEEFPSLEDQPVMAELKRILLLRIADIEFVGAAVHKANSEAAQHQDAVRLPAIEDDPEAA